MSAKRYFVEKNIAEIVLRKISVLMSVSDRVVVGRQREISCVFNSLRIGTLSHVENQNM